MKYFIKAAFVAIATITVSTEAQQGQQRRMPRNNRQQMREDPSDLKQQLLQEKLERDAIRRAQNEDGTPDLEAQRNIMLNSQAHAARDSYQQQNKSRAKIAAQRLQEQQEEEQIRQMQEAKFLQQQRFEEQQFEKRQNALAIARAKAMQAQQEFDLEDHQQMTDAQMMALEEEHVDQQAHRYVDQAQMALSEAQQQKMRMAEHEDHQDHTDEIAKQEKLISEMQKEVDDAIEIENKIVKQLEDLKNSKAHPTVKLTKQTILEEKLAKVKEHQASRGHDEFIENYSQQVPAVIGSSGEEEIKKKVEPKKAIHAADKNQKKIEKDWLKKDITISMEVLLGGLVFSAFCILCYICNQCGAFGGGSGKRKKKSRAQIEKEDDQKDPTRRKRKQVQSV